MVITVLYIEDSPLFNLVQFCLAAIAYKINEEVENIGARRLHTVMSHLLNSFLFDVPDKIGPNEEIIVTKDLVVDRLTELVTNKDLSEYIL